MSTIYNKIADFGWWLVCRLADVMFPRQCTAGPGWRLLSPRELPVVGDEAWNEFLGKWGAWQTVEVPSMWLAGGKRIRGTVFRRRVQPNDTAS